MEAVVDAVVCDPVLGVVISPYLFGALGPTHLSPPGLGISADWRSCSASNIRARNIAIAFCLFLC